MTVGHLHGLDLLEFVAPVAGALQRRRHAVLRELRLQLLEGQLHCAHALACMGAGVAIPVQIYADRQPPPSCMVNPLGTAQTHMYACYRRLDFACAAANGVQFT